MSIKKKRVSKKLKVSWRKHVNIDDVEDFLEEKRSEEKLGPPLATVSNSELFILDTKLTKPIDILSPRQRRANRLSKPLKCFSALEPDSKVPDPIAKRNRVRTKEERRSALVKNKERENALKGILKQKQIQRSKDRKIAELKRQDHNSVDDLDVWNAEEPINNHLKNEWVGKNTKKHILRNSGKVPRKNINIPKAKLAVFPAIEPPHPGMSYNPAYQDYKDLLKTITDKEENLIKEEEHLMRVTHGMFKKVSESSRDGNWLIEMSEGLVKEEPSTSEETKEEKEFKSLNPPVKNVKKTLKQRRKQKEQQDLQRALRNKKIEKKKISDLHVLKRIDKQLAKASAEQKIQLELRKKRLEKKAKSVKRLTKMKYEEPDLEFNMVNDLTDNLRNIKTEGNVLQERFRSLQKRNILQPTKKHTRKSAKIKRYTKPGHKDNWKETVAFALK